MPFYIGDYLADTLGLSLAEHGAYFLSILAYWRKGGPLSDLEIRSICNSHCDRVCRFFVKLPAVTTSDSSPTWRHKRIELELKAAKSNSTKQAARTEAARAALLKKHASRKPSVTGTVTNSPSPSPSPLSPTKKLKVENSDKAEKASANGKPLNPQQGAIAIRFELALNGQWRNDSGKWINRIRSHLRLTERVIAEVESAIKEHRVKTTPAQYAQQIWKEFSGPQKP